MTPRSLALDGDTHLLVLTGAGVSAESGIPTFREAGGLWEQHSLEDVATPEGFARDPRLVWRFYSERRAAARICTPNPGHHALAEAERRLGDRFLLVTQNIDGLHLAAGSERVIEIHGQLYRTRCAHCNLEPFEDFETIAGKLAHGDFTAQDSSRQASFSTTPTRFTSCFPRR